jgi:hypothetical protein
VIEQVLVVVLVVLARMPRPVVKALTEVLVLPQALQAHPYSGLAAAVARLTPVPLPDSAAMAAAAQAVVARQTETVFLARPIQAAAVAVVAAIQRQHQVAMAAPVL